MKIEAEEVLVEESPVDPNLVTRLLPKLDYNAILSAVKDITDVTDPKPPEIPAELILDGNGNGNGDGQAAEEAATTTSTTTTLSDSALEALHHVLFNIHILEGNLVCPDTGRKFPIKQGIPNMILHEDEI